MGKYEGNSLQLGPATCRVVQCQCQGRERVTHTVARERVRRRARTVARQTRYCIDAARHMCPLDQVATYSYTSAATLIGKGLRLAMGREGRKPHLRLHIKNTKL